MKNILSVLMAIIFASSLGFVFGFKHGRESKKCVKVTPGYVKIGYGRGLTAAGDTIRIYEYADIH